LSPDFFFRPFADRCDCKVVCGLDALSASRTGPEVMLGLSPAAEISLTGIPTGIGRSWPGEVGEEGSPEAESVEEGGDKTECDVQAAAAVSG